MKAKEIKQAIAAEGYTLSMIAEALGVKLATVSHTVNGHSKSLKVASCISRVINKPLAEVFPNHEGIIKRSTLKEKSAAVSEIRQLLAS